MVKEKKKRPVGIGLVGIRSSVDSVVFLIALRVAALEMVALVILAQAGRPVSP